MKVAMIANFPPMDSPEADHAFHLADRLARRGIVVHVITKRGSIGHGGHQRVIIHPMMKSWSWTELPKLIWMLRRCSPDVILVIYVFWSYHGLAMITYLPSVCKLFLGRARFVTLFEDATGVTPWEQTPVWESGPAARAIRKASKLLAGSDNVDLLYGTLLRDSDDLIVVSDRVADALAARFPAIRNKVTSIPVPPIIFMADDSETVRQATRRALGATRDDFLLAYIGYIYPTKGIETLLEALRRVTVRRRNIKLVVVGGVIKFPGRPRYLEELRGMTREFGIMDTVHWTGPFAWNSDEGSRYLRASDICVLPYDTGVCGHNSSFAVAVAHGLPIVTTRGDSLEPLFLDGENVLLCPPKNPELLASATERLMDDSALRRRLQTGALALAEQVFSWDRATTDTLSVLANKAGTRR
jgi:glycosyltransferase involved in cell wall biosynthesis